MKRPIPRGLLVAVEGIDGAGKTTIAGLLAQWCGERGLGCMISKEPTGLKWGNELRKSAKEGRLEIDREIELFILDRRDHVRRAIAPALQEGSIVILDRYYWSSAAYQGARGADWQQIIQRNEEFAPRPDLVLVLDIEPDGGLERIKGRGDRPNLFETKKSLMLSRQIFLQLNELNPGFSRVVSTFGQIKTAFEESLGHFQCAAVEKIQKSGPLHPEMVNLVGVFMGAEPILDAYPESSGVMSPAIEAARDASR